MKLLFKPTINVIGETKMDPDGIRAWVIDIGMEAALEEGTTLSKLLANDGVAPMELLIEFAGRMCYRSFFKGRNTVEYLINIIEMGHGSVLEHASINFAIAGVSRSFTHELVRHRVGTAISQESQRYVDASDINFVVPYLLREKLKNSLPAYAQMKQRCQPFIDSYNEIQEELKQEAAVHNWDGRMLTKRVNEAAREVLPNMAETRVVWTCNLRELRHVMLLRGNEAADLQFMEVTQRLFELFQKRTPIITHDLTSVPVSEGVASMLPGAIIQVPRCSLI